MSRQEIILAYSGGLDTTWCVPWIRENLDADVVTVNVDVGGLTADGRERLARTSRAAGAIEHIAVDARSDFFDQVIRFLIAGNVLRGNLYPICVGAERSLQARRVARVAVERGAGAIAHGCTAAGNDQIRFEIALRSVAPDLAILAPVRDEAPSREDEIAFVRARGLDVGETDAVYSINTGLWGVTIGGRETLDTVEPLPEEAWIKTRGAFDAPRSPSRHRIAFDKGVPVALDGTAGAPVDVIERIDELAASYGIGRGIHLGDTLLGAKGRVAFEAPAAGVIIPAHRELEKLTLTAAQRRLKDIVAATYGELIHAGRWVDPCARDVEAYLASTQERVTGVVTVALRPGTVFVEGVASPHSLHAASRSVYGEAAVDWSPRDAAGFCRLSSVPYVLQARADEAGGVS